ncbi:MAG: Arc family DNA-binding protein [Gammaproteobacteria bacterium]|nr:Arc family DNA-binding protein [Gammaproteobacteria bacterium]
MKQKPYKFVVRLPLDMRDRIGEAAQHYRRSMNSEIVARLEQSFSALPSQDAERQVEPPLHPQLERMFRSNLNDQENLLIKSFRRLSLERQAALLSLLT